MTARARKAHPAVLSGSEASKKQAAVILEVLSGTTTTVDGSRSLGISLPRYYQIESRALQGMLTALEPRKRGKRSEPTHELEQLRRDNERLRRDVTRFQALLRASQRAIGLTAPKALDKSKLAGKRRRRKTARALRVVEALRTGQDNAQAAEKAEA